jgi:hypothetical protein
MYTQDKEYAFIFQTNVFRNNSKCNSKFKLVFTSLGLADERAPRRTVHLPGQIQ